MRKREETVVSYEIYLKQHYKKDPMAEYQCRRYIQILVNNSAKSRVGLKRFIFKFPTDFSTFHFQK